MRNLIVPIIKPIRVLLGMSLLMLVGCAGCGNKNGHLPSPRHPLKNSKNKNFKKFSPAPDDGGQEGYTREVQDQGVQTDYKGKKDSIDLNQSDSAGRTQLHNFFAYSEKDEELVKKAKLLMDYSADLTVTDNWGRNLVHEAVYGNNLELTQYLLERLEAQNPAQVKAMLNQAEKSPVGGTCFVYAAHNGNIALTKLLLQKGAEPTTEDLSKAMKNSIRKGDLPMLQYLVDEVIEGRGKMIAKEDKFPTLAQAAQEGHADIVEYLIDKFDEHGSLVCAKDEAGNTALHHAAMQGNRPAMNVLLAKGAKVDEPRNDGKIPLHLAAEQGHDAFVNALLSNPAAIDRQDQADQTALHLAAKQGHQRVVRVLLAKHANKNLLNQAGQTPLAVAHQALQASNQQGEENTRKNLKITIARLSKVS